MFVATLIRSSLGFGEALIAVPLLAFFLPLRVATPLAVLLSITVAAVVVAQDWRHIHLRSAAGLVAATVAGIPLGLLVLTHVHPEIAKCGLGVLIVLFAAFSLAAPSRLRMEHEHRAVLLLVGLVAGVLGGAYGMNGPPLAVYGSLRRWSPQHFRATLQAYFLPASMLGMCGYWAAGLWKPEVTHDYLLCLPAMLPAVLLGRAINRRLPAAVFSRYVYVGLMGIGVSLLAAAFVRLH